MILNQNYDILVTFTVYLLVTVVCKFVRNRFPMHSKPTLTSIPERVEADDEIEKWVSKKKHDVLKAKYKCLKKLFQIYDASVIGILPVSNIQDPIPEDDEKIRKKKSRRTKTDAYAATEAIEVNDGGKAAADAVIKDLKLDQVPSTDINKSKSVISKFKDDKSTQDSKENLSIVSEKEIEIQPHPVPYLVINEKRKPTRFQSFIQRILGIRRERYSYVMSNEREYALSDNNISNRYEKRRRRGIRLRRSRRTKKVHSEIALRDVNSPVILSYVQSIQRDCLMDTTPRYCPILGCKMLLYGIINYNDHLNLSHFAERTHVCVYCHEGFASERDKAAHEQEHIGITKMAAAPSASRFSTKIASNTQTDPEISKLDIPEDKLKKIVSFFDKISDPDQMIAEFKKNRSSDTNLLTLHRNPRTAVDSMSGSDSSDTEKSFSVKMRSKVTSTVNSDASSKYTCVQVSVRCQLCGERFDYRSQLHLHMEEHHRPNSKFIKYNSCAGIINRTSHGVSTPGQTPTESLTRSLASTDVSNLSRRKSDETLSYEPSTNIVYYTSTETVRKPSLVQKVRSNFCYKWEPGTKIIRV